MNAIRTYWTSLGQSLSDDWNQFWFTPCDALVLSVVRILTGCFALYFVVSFTPDLSIWFAADGMLAIDTVQELTGNTSGGLTRPSYLMFIQDPTWMLVAHGLGIAVLVAMTIGFQTRVACALSVCVVLSYVHRAPMITGQFEPVLTMMLLYLVVGPCGNYLSVDAWWRSRRDDAVTPLPSVSANISVRLMQVHLAAFYFLMACSKLSGDTWWSGEALWWLIAQADTRLIDLTSWHAIPRFYLVNLWTHAVVLFEFAFALLIWRRQLRPLLLAISVPMWLLLIPVTGLAAYCLLMIVAGAVFVDGVWLRTFLTQTASRGATNHASPAAA